MTGYRFGDSAQSKLPFETQTYSIKQLAINFLPFTDEDDDLLSSNEPFPGTKSFGTAFSVLALARIVCQLASLLILGGELQTQAKRSALLSTLFLGFGLLQIYILRTALQHYPGAALQTTLIQTQELAKELNRQPDKRSIYWPGHLYQIWISLKHASYYNSQQASPVIFSPTLSREVKARLNRVRAFQLYEARNQENPKSLRRIHQIYGAFDKSITQPGLSELEQLCATNGPDWVVLDYKIAKTTPFELPKAYLYECKYFNGKDSG